VPKHEHLAAFVPHEEDHCGTDLGARRQRRNQRRRGRENLRPQTVSEEAALLADAMLLVWDYRDLCRKQGLTDNTRAIQDLLDRYEALVMDNDE
jgi:hypothetical protein